MICCNIVTFTVGSDLVTAHAATNLVLPKLTESSVLDLVVVFSNARLEDSSSSATIFVLRTSCRLRLDAGRKVSHHYAAVGSVPMLSTGTCIASRFDADVTIKKLELLLGEHLNHRHRDRAGVNTSLPLGWRNSLPAVTTGFVQELFNEGVVTAHLEINSAFVKRDLGLETVILGVAKVDLCLLLTEELGVHSALSWANLDCDFHVMTFVNKKDGGSK